MIAPELNLKIDQFDIQAVKILPQHIVHLECVAGNVVDLRLGGKP